MSIQVLREMLFWSSIINTGLFSLSFLILKFGRKFIFRMHGKWFDLSEDKFNAIMYTLMGFYKICILVFNIVPCIALYITG